MSSNSSLAGPSFSNLIPSQVSSTFGGFMRNKIINGDFNLWTRATTFSTPGNTAYTADQWRTTYDGTIGAFTLSRQAFTVGQTAVPDEPTYYLQWNQTGAGSGSTFRRIDQPVEDVRAFAGQTVVLSCGLSADSGRSVTANLVQSFGSGGSSDVVVTAAEGAASVTSSFQIFTFTFTVPSISGKTVGAGSSLKVMFSLPINTTMMINLSHVQLERNAKTTFEQRLPYEPALGSRYLKQIQFPVPVLASPAWLGYGIPMRATPTITGGASGFTTASADANSSLVSQTSAATQTLIISAEL